MAVKQETNTEVSQLFPQTVSTEQSSLNYMKRLTAVAISNILYLRNAFSEECYGHRKLDHLKLRILTERCETVAAKQIVQWVKGCFDAMEKKYLKQLTLAIYTDPTQPEEVIEAYTFRFTYHSNQFNCNISLNEKRGEIKFGDQTATDLRTATIQLMRSLVIMVQTLDQLPNESFITMKLLYYDDITPQDYEPPGFMATDSDSFSFKGKALSINAGEVITPFHSIKVKVRTNQKQFEDLVPSENSSENNDMNESKHECTSLPFDDSVGDNNNNSSENDSKSDLLLQKIRSPLKPTKNSVKQEMKRTNSSKANSKGKADRSDQKAAENSVISKLKDMKVGDNCLQREEKRSIISNKRKADYEVTQDSVFHSDVMSGEKRFKASKTNEIVSIGKRR